MTDHTVTARSSYAAFGAGDIPAVLAVFAPDIRWTAAVSFQQHTDTALHLRPM